jgi:thymidine phosphorylase
MTFELLGIDVSRIIELRDLLDMMDICRLSASVLAKKLNTASLDWVSKFVAN